MAIQVIQQTLHIHPPKQVVCMFSLTEKLNAIHEEHHKFVAIKKKKNIKHTIIRGCFET